MDSTRFLRGAAGLAALLMLLALSASAGTPGVRVVPWDDGRVGVPTPHPSALSAVDDCDQLRSYATEAIIDTLVRYRYGWWMFESPWSSPGVDSGGGGTPTDFTGTNNQEEGVDELDVMKTDGWYIYVAMGDNLTIVRSWPAASSEVVSRLPIEGYPHGLFLYGDRAMVISSFWDDGDFPTRYWSGTRLDVIDVSDRSNPFIVRTIQLEGYLVGARMIDGHVYGVVFSWMDIPHEAWDLIWGDGVELPEPDWYDDEAREAAADLAREILRPLVAEIVAGLDLQDLVPMARDWSIGHPDPGLEPLLQCQEVMRPAKASSFSYLDVLHLDLGADDPQSTPLQVVGLLAEGWTIYASLDSLYVAQSGGWWWWSWPSEGRKTVIHKFVLDPDDEEPVSYAATGQVPGWLLDQFSMSEHEGFLRVATTEFDWWWWGNLDDDDEGSLVTVLADTGRGRLEQVGQVRGIAPGEQIFATRFLGDRGFLVTFERIDPLFSLDLSNPYHPEVVGELELPGFSTYLHPMDEDHLLAVGMKGDMEGRITGLVVNLFDVSDMSSPELQDQYVIENHDNVWSWSEALHDHHAFTFHRGVLSFPVYISTGWFYFSGLEVVSVDADEGIVPIGRVDHHELPPPGHGYHYPYMRRSAYIEDYLYSLSTWGIKVNELFDPDEEIAVVPFYE